MMRVKLICAGKLKEKFYQQACDEYAKRLSAFCRLEICQIPEENRPDGLAREAEKFRQAILPDSYIVALCVEGKLLSSEELSRRIGARKNLGNSRLSLLIGSSNGLDEGLKAQAHLRLSMSPMTFPHHLARVMLLEQLYRAFSIDAGSKYHK